MSGFKYLYGGYGYVEFPCTFTKISPILINTELASGSIYRRRNVSSNTATLKPESGEYNWYCSTEFYTFQAEYAATFASTGYIANGTITSPIDLANSDQIKGTLTVTDMCLRGNREDSIYATKGSRFSVEIEFTDTSAIAKCIGTIPKCYSSYMSRNALLAPTETTVVSFTPSE